MRDPQGHVPDWRDAAAYTPLLAVGRQGLAWEWLRRDPAYFDAALGIRDGGGVASPAGVEHPGAARWGLHAFEPPALDARLARPVWRRDCLAEVLVADAVLGSNPGDLIDLGRLGALVTVVGGECGQEHVLLCDGRSALRLDIISGSIGAGPVMLRYRIEGVARAAAPLLVLRQLLALVRSGTFARALHPPEQRAARWVALLRTHDALAAGASQREIAALLLGRGALAPRWRIEEPSLRSRAQRLVRDARRLACGGYLSLLS